MNEIKVNEEMTELAMIASNMAKLKRSDPDVYERVMREVINSTKRSVESDMEGRDQFTAMLCKSAIEAVLNRIYDDPFAMVEIEQMVQEIGNNKREDKES